jgi:hypothetical protein
MGRVVREELRGLLVWIPAQVSVRRDFMIAKDPRAIALKTLRQKQMFRDHGSIAGIIRMLNPEYLDFIPVGSAQLDRGEPEPWKFLAR